MILIRQANEDDADLLTPIALTTFLESHGHSAPPEDIRSYTSEKYKYETLYNELKDRKNIYHIIYQNEKAAGFSKIIYDHPFEKSPVTNITKLERIYLLKEFYGTRLAQKLFGHILELVKHKKQAGIWLYVWKDNPRAFHFYEKNGFVIIGSHDFDISPKHSNPNYVMFLDLRDAGSKGNIQ